MSLDLFYESCLVLFIYWYIFFPRKGNQSLSQGDLSEAILQMSIFRDFLARKEGVAPSKACSRGQKVRRPEFKS
jgi:hypothetical protein